MYIISVKDDAIASLAEKLTFTEGLVVHTAGSAPIDMFAGKLKNYGALYPLQTFSKLRPVNFSDIPIFIEANTSENLYKLRTVAQAISHKIYDASSDKRMQLHLAAVFGCNFVNSLYQISAKVAQQAGFDFSVLSTLIIETAKKAIASGNPKEVQTGPAVRNDLKVMSQHLEMLASRPEWKEIYATLSENIKKPEYD